jgi:glyoxylase-like metal-dependent hydrolase (beta-lactamase superfamily II)
MEPGAHRFSVGSFQCLAVADGTFTYPIAMFVANAPADRLAQELRDRGRPVDHVVTPYTCLVVDTGQNRVLVDTGIGALPPDFPPTTNHLQDNLRAAGVDPASIDTVILTHGHADHIGGNVAEDRPAFPRARFAMWRTEWDFWTSEPSLAELTVDDHIKELLRAWARTNLLPLRDRIDLIDREGEIVPGINAIAAPGHTPGHMALSIVSGSDTVLDLVDTALDPLQLAHPDWVAAVDFDPAQVVATRRRLFDRAAAEGARVLCYHFPFPGLGRVRKAGDGWQWEPAVAG